MRFLHSLFHWWQTVRDNGKTVYQECAVCKKRRAWQRDTGGYQPICQHWVEGGEFNRPLKLPRGGSSTAYPVLCLGGFTKIPESD